mmetsp:Transcript_78103/g.220881  ORF Transcript_78103/g.220881 Transcript_78103/m.220881 type:complete len:287 (+) Transcript_78103:1242-2102(+)
MDVGGPHAQNFHRVMYWFHRAGRPRHEELPVDGGVEAGQPALRGRLHAGAQPLQELQAAGEPLFWALRRLLAGRAQARREGLAHELHEREQVVAHQLQPPGQQLRRWRGVLAQGPPLLLEAAPDLAEVGGEDARLQVDAKQAGHEVLVVKNSSSEDGTPCPAAGAEEGVGEGAEGGRGPHEPLQVLQVQAAETCLHNRVALKPEQVVHEELVPDCHQLLMRGVLRHDPRSLGAVQRHVRRVVEARIHLGVHDLNRGHRIKETELRALNHLTELHALHCQVADVGDV